ncbi:MAG: FAD binding domain-containing protein [Candidatus Aureabacteria bacterium]|nr:FAD binding domain-containing protein [Candidatus Auribacterota bacterium]
MATRIKMIHYPRSARELTALLDKGKGRIAPVGGGVSFSFSSPPKIVELASLRSLGLDRIVRGQNGLRLGAMVTIAQLAASPDAARFRNGLLATAASRVAATTNRNLITVGGNAIRLFIWSDLPSVYCAMGAVFKVRGTKGMRKISCDEFYAAQPLTVLKHTEFLEEIIIPAADHRSGGAFEKFSETSNTFAFVSAAACVTLGSSGRCASARLVIGGLRLLPRVSGEAARILEGHIASPELIQKAAAATVGAVKVVRDIRVSDEYKKELASTVARRVLENAFRLAGGKK